MKKTAIFLNFCNRVNGKTGSHSQKSKYCPYSSAERDAFSYGFRLGVQLMAEAFLLPIGEDE